MLPLFTFDEVWKFEIAAINERRTKRGRDKVGPPKRSGKEVVRTPEVVPTPIGGLGPDDIDRITDPEEISRRQRLQDPSITRPQPVPNDMTGLSLSGGGVRSAAFCLGAMQALNTHEALDKFDYLSTVSGGGYIGAAVTAAMSVNDGTFPFATGADDIRDADSVGHLRNFSNYLMPRNRSFLQNAGEAAVILTRGIACNLAMIVPPLLLLAVVAGALFVKTNGFENAGFFASILGLISPVLGNNVTAAALMLLALAAGFAMWWEWGNLDAFDKRFVSLVCVVGIILGSIVVGFSQLFEFVRPFLDFFAGISLGLPLFLLASFAWLLLCWALLRSVQGYRGGDAGSFFLTFCWVLLWISLAATAFELIPPIMRGLVASCDLGKTRYVKVWPWQIDPRLLIIAVALLVSGVVVAFASGRLVAAGSSGRRASLLWLKRISSQALLLVGASSFPLALLVTFAWLCAFCATLEAMTMLKIVGFAGVLFIMALALGRNSYSLHRFYRDRLEAAFLAKEAFYPKTSDVPKDPTDRFLLSSLSTETAPYHLLNTALNLQGSETANQRGREADFFTFSPQFIGSDLTFYAPLSSAPIALHGKTTDFEAVEPSLDLASVVAISGAAASANMGSSTVRILSPTLAFLNVRLGYWLLNPRNSNPLRRRLWTRVWGKFYLLLEMFGLLDETSDQLYLTDGGHIENLGVYQLLKRGCQLIVAIDAEADPEMTFGSLIKLERFARIDLGVRINLPWEGIASSASYDAEEFRAKITDDHHPGHPHCAIGKILYPDQSEGILVYIKASISGDERDYILDYKRRNSAFPHETTADQFFTEEQFEVYRALGFHIVDGLFSRRDNVSIKAAPLLARDPLDEVYKLLKTLLPGAKFS